MPVYVVKCYDGCKVIGKGKYSLWPSVAKQQAAHEEETGHNCEIIDLDPHGTMRMTPEPKVKKVKKVKVKKPKAIPQRDILQAYLIDNGPQTLHQLYDKVNLPEGSIRRVLSTHKGFLFGTFGPYWRVLPDLSDLSKKDDKAKQTSGNLKQECEWLGIGGLGDVEQTGAEIQMVSEQTQTGSTEEEGQTLG